MKLPVPKEIMQQIQEAEDLPNYVNRKQLSLAIEVSLATINNWRAAGNNSLPSPDLIIGNKKYWTPHVISSFIEVYRREKNKPIA